MTPRACEVCGGTEFRYLFTRNEHDFCRCRSCRLVRIDPQPTDEVLATIYDDKYFEAWGGQAGADRVSQLKKDTFRKHVLNAVNLKRGAKVLDCGAAFGDLMEVAKETGLEPYGIELVPEAAAEIGRRFGLDRVFSGPFEQASFPGLGEGGFDGVFMCDFIEHVRDPLAVLKKAANLLRPSGCLVLTTPDTDSLSSRLMGASWPLYDVEHLYCFDRRNMAVLLQRAGYTVKNFGPARKVIDLAYIRDQLNARPRPLLTPVFNILTGFVGRRLINRPLSFSLGQMIGVGIKN